MADEGYITSLLAGISNPGDRKILQDAFQHLLRQMTFGEPDGQTKATNFGAYYQASTTATSTGEFSISHGMSVTPRLAIPVLNLNQQGCRLADLEVSRVADGRRIYLKAAQGSTNAAIFLLVE